MNDSSADIKYSIAHKIIKNMPADLINSQVLGPFLYGTGAANDEAYRNIYAANLARNEALKKKEKEVIDSFQQAGIDSISLKGVSQIEDLYGDLGLRPTTDIDILIKPENLKKAADVLIKNNLRLCESEKDSADNPKSQLTFLSANNTMVDLHWDLLESERYKKVIYNDIADLWNSSDEQSGIRPEVKLNFLVLHISVTHFFSRLYWLMDIALLLQKYGSRMNWKYVFDVSKKWRIHQSLLLSLELCRDLFDSDIGFAGKLPKLKYRTAVVKKYLKNHIFNTEPQLIESKKYVLGLLIRDTYTDLIRVAFNAIFPPAQWIKEKYNAKSKITLNLFRIIHPIYSVFMAFDIRPLIKK